MTLRIRIPFEKPPPHHDCAGRGTHSFIRVVRTPDRNVFAVKSTMLKRLRRVEERRLWNEIDILRTVRHPHILKFHRAEVESDVVHMFTEWCPMGDLHSILQGRTHIIEESFVWKVLVELLDALRSLHTREVPIIHRDIQPSNILFDRAQKARLADFGLAVRRESSGCTLEPCGSHPYASVEQRIGGAYDESSDIWSLGCTMFEMCSRHPPFQHQSNTREVLLYVATRGTPEIPPFYSAKLRRVLRRMMSLDPAERPTAVGLLAEIAAGVITRSPTRKIESKRRKPAKRPVSR
jgi:serine/threonine protein kinase